MDARHDQKDDGPVIRNRKHPHGVVKDLSNYVLVVDMFNSYEYDRILLGDTITASVCGRMRHGSATVTHVDRQGEKALLLNSDQPWGFQIPAIAVGDAVFASPKQEPLPPSSLRADVALMRELGVLQWKGIMLDPTWKPASLETEAKHRPAPRSEVHKTYWRKFTRASGAAIPLCSPRCQCGGWAKDQANGDDE